MITCLVDISDISVLHGTMFGYNRITI